MRPRDFVISNNIRFSHCVYTVIPVIDGQLLDLPFHLQRLCHSACAVHADTDCLNPLFFNDLIADSCLKSFASYRWNRATDGLLTICVGSDSDVGDENYYQIERDRCRADSYLYGMEKSFLFESRSDLKVDLQEDMRLRDLTIKSASWPTDRLRMESLRPQGVAETVMFKSEPKSLKSEGAFSQVFGMPHTKTLTEGLTSNLFVCENNRLITAVEGDALSGSMSRIVIAAAHSLGITVERKSPQIFDSEPTSWSSAFLTSVARPMHMIKSVVHPNGESMFEIPVECETSSAIRKVVKAALNEKEDTFLREYIPYPLWSDPITPDISESELRRIFSMHSAY